VKIYVVYIGEMSQECELSQTHTREWHHPQPKA